MRTLPLLSLLALAAACAAPASEQVLPVAAGLRGAADVEAVAIELRPAVRAGVAALDEQAARRPADAGIARLPLAQMLARTIEEAAAAAGLDRGRQVRLVVELDEAQVAGTGSALVGGADKLAGTVFVRDAATGAPLGQLYVDIQDRNPGLVGLALRGGGVRERLARAFAAEIVRQLGPAG